MSVRSFAPLRATAVIDESDPSSPGAADHDQFDERAGLLAHRQARRRARTRRVMTGLGGLVALVLLWQMAAVIISDQVALPSVIQTGEQFVHYLGRPYPAQGKPLWFDLYISLWRILVGFVIGVTIAIAGLVLDACLRGLLIAADPSRRG